MGSRIVQNVVKIVDCIGDIDVEDIFIWVT